MVMDVKNIIQNHKTMHENQIKPFSPKTKLWTPRTKPWTLFQDLCILGDFSNPKTKVTRFLLSSFKMMCECLTIKHKHMLTKKKPPKPCQPQRTKPQILFMTYSSFMHLKHPFTCISFSTLDLYFSTIEKQKINIL